MSCNNNITTKNLGESWNFFYKQQAEDGTFEDLNGALYDFILLDSDKQEIKKESNTITISGEELIVSILGSLTKDYNKGIYYVAFKVTDAQGGTIIEDSGKFEALETLFFNQSE